MPLIGIVLPEHKEKASAMPGRYPKWITLEKALETAEIASPKWSSWTYELIRAMSEEHQERGSRLSVTALVGGCMRGTMVERKMDYIADLDNFYPALRGQLLHHVLETYNRPGSLAEWRFYTNINGVEISGSPDLVTYDTIWDYKMTENPPPFDYMWKSHKLQLQFNRYIFNHATKWDAPAGQDPLKIPLDPHNTKIRHLVIVYLGPKGPKTLEAVRSVEVKTRGGGVRKVREPDVWSDDQVLAEMAPRIEAWNMAWESFPDWPEGLENYPGWAGPPTFRCSGPPLCYLPNCMAQRYPDGLVWESPEN
jgi:hypothetical protein